VIARVVQVGVTKLVLELLLGMMLLEEVLNLEKIILLLENYQLKLMVVFTVMKVINQLCL